MVPENFKIALVWDSSHEVSRKEKYKAEKKFFSFFKCSNVYVLYYE